MSSLSSALRSVQQPIPLADAQPADPLTSSLDIYGHDRLSRRGVVAVYLRLPYQDIVPLLYYPTPLRTNVRLPLSLDDLESAVSECLRDIPRLDPSVIPCYEEFHYLGVVTFVYEKAFKAKVLEQLTL